jgi:SH3-like domain-containing protein
LVNRNTAIVFSPSVTVRSAPDAGSTELFVLHEGVKVKLLQQNNNWYEIQIEDGNVGWIHAEHVEVI